MYFDLLSAPSCVNLAGTVVISGPASFPRNQTGTYSLSVGGLTAGSTPYTYTWSLSRGSILSGQGTSSITINAPSTGSLTITLVVSNCGNSLTGNAVVSVGPAQA